VFLATCSLLALSFSSAAETQKSGPQCQKPIYLTFDTGHMGVAPLIADVLRKHQVPVTFFGANEKTKEGDGSLGQYWSAWWKERAAEGHDFASHTYDHAYWRADMDANQFKIRPSAGDQKDQNLILARRRLLRQLEKGRSATRSHDGSSQLAPVPSARRQNLPGPLEGCKSMWFHPRRLVTRWFFGR
jgi:peptidoglycan/xylan/chitin deacetylase (PgdA/CDA1 family)